jgi:hypothetical protein
VRITDTEAWSSPVAPGVTRVVDVSLDSEMETVHRSFNVSSSVSPPKSNNDCGLHFTMACAAQACVVFGVGSKKVSKTQFTLLRWWCVDVSYRAHTHTHTQKRNIKRYIQACTKDSEAGTHIHTHTRTHAHAHAHAHTQRKEEKEVMVMVERKPEETALQLFAVAHWKVEGGSK